MVDLVPLEELFGPGAKYPDLVILTNIGMNNVDNVENDVDNVEDYG